MGGLEPATCSPQSPPQEPCRRGGCGPAPLPPHHCPSDNHRASGQAHSWCPLSLTCPLPQGSVSPCAQRGGGSMCLLGDWGQLPKSLQVKGKARAHSKCSLMSSASQDGLWAPGGGPRGSLCRLPGTAELATAPGGRRRPREVKQPAQVTQPIGGTRGTCPNWGFSSAVAPHLPGPRATCCPSAR